MLQFDNWYWSGFDPELLQPHSLKECDVLFTIDGKRIKKVPHRKEFDSVLGQLQHARADEIRQGLVDIIDNLDMNSERGIRTFSSSFLGSELSPWPYPLKHIYDISWEIEGRGAPDEIVEARAGLIFGLFVWESIMQRNEKWVFYDPNLSSSDPNREITGKVYFESDS